jgi:hypothetical protein
LEGSNGMGRWKVSGSFTPFRMTTKTNCGSFPFDCARGQDDDFNIAFPFVEMTGLRSPCSSTLPSSQGVPWLFRCFFVFEELSGLFEVEEVAVYDELIVARVFRYGEDALNGVSAFANSFDEKIDVYHACEFTPGWLAGIKG